MMMIMMMMMMILIRFVRASILADYPTLIASNELINFYDELFQGTQHGLKKS
jgi:hypothetical protein